jgi:hypothetical protein
VSAAPELAFEVLDVTPSRTAAVPTLSAHLRIDAGGRAVRGLTLGVRVHIRAERRRYGEAEGERLRELFGAPEAWARSLGPIVWTRTTVHVGPFDGSTLVEVGLPCSYDFEVAAAKYLNALEDGRVPLELQFEGTVFWNAQDGRLQSAPVPWDREAQTWIALESWRQALAAAFGDCAWLRVHRDVFQELQAERSRRGLTSWEATIGALLEEARR